MIALLGTFGVGLGLIGAIGGAVTLAMALLSRHRDHHRRVFVWVAIMISGCALAVTAMEIGILRDDFSMQYVAANSPRATPLLYKIATLWGALEGSLLLWALVLSGYVTAVSISFRRRIEDRLVAWALLTMLATCIFFFALLFGPADPFGTLLVAPPDGEGLNPLLRNHPLMAIHPVMLYLGYVGFTVPFGFAVAALITGRLGEGWLVTTRTWTLIAWVSLTVGILLGAWWSYEVLGWGGYWAWDPVENASFLPWLTGTAFIHSVVVQERRGMLRVWNLSLLLATFALTIFGTFLTRSGVIESVHEFSASSLGPLLLGFFATILVVSVALVGWRGDQLRSPGSIDSPISREGAFLANNLLFTLFAFVILLGTIFPLIVEAINNEQLAVGRPYFDRMLLPLGVALLLVMGLAPLLTWRSTDGQLLGTRALGPAALGAVTMAVAVWLGAEGIGPVLGIGLGGFVIGSALRHLLLATRRNGWHGLIGRSGGGMVAHIGVSLLAFGFIASTSFSEEGEFQLQPGETGSVAGHQIRFVGLTDEMHGPNRVVRAHIEVQGRGVYAPAITQYPTFGRPIATPSVATSLIDDVYLSLVAIPEEDSDVVVIRVLVEPLVGWIWVGGLVIAAGTLLAMVPTRASRRSEIEEVVL
ncbi:MAG: heme lyase CcmF/NrfE family subunit [Actinomycetota bacterium]|nr:heme lyase CcmF/NrfE family subunit [Actinomycetota bacterium]